MLESRNKDKKQLLVLSFVANFAFGAVWSSIVTDGINQAFAKKEILFYLTNTTNYLNKNPLKNFTFIK